MATSHQRIVDGAARLMRERGLESASVADVMSGAGLTHGGFYRHFATKDQLAVEAVDHAFAGFAGRLEQGLEADAARAVLAFCEKYLSVEHVRHSGVGCPVPALAADVARVGSPEVRRSFDAGVARIVDALATGLPGTKRQRRDHALRRFALLAGAVLIARAAGPETAQQTLEACRAALHE